MGSLTVGRPVTIRMSDEGPERKYRYETPTGIRGDVTVMRQVGWLGQTGNVYAFVEGEDVVRAGERGGYAPLYMEVGD